MPKISLDNLERYDGHLKDWCDARFAERKVHENWHEAGPSGAVSFYPVPNRPIDPVVNFAFTETLSEGTKGPDNPSTITGVTQVKVTRCGKNLFEHIGDGTVTSNGLTLVRNVDGTCTLSGTATANTFFYINSSNLIQTKAGLTYTLSGCPSDGSASTYRLACAASKNGTAYYYVDYGSGNSASKSFDARWQMYIYVASGAVISTPVVFKPQLELGSTATAFEPYDGADYTVNLGGTYYGGSVDLSTGVMTVTWKGVVFTGAENFTLEYSPSAGVYQYGFALSEYSKAYSDSYMKCSHFTFGSTAAGQFYVRNTGGGGIRFYSDISTVQGFKDFLASQYANGTPVTVVYESLNSATVPLTPLQIYSLSQPDPYTPRINTVYSDQQSVLVRYPKSPIVTGSELDNAILSLGGD